MKTTITDYYIYAYIDPATDTPFYIGAGHNGRDMVHLACAKNNRRHHNPFLINKIKKLLRQDIEPSIHCILTGLTRDEAFKVWEPFFIGALGRRDLDTGVLCNLTDGGEGGINFGPETRARMSAAAKITSARPEVKARRSAAIKIAHARPEVKTRLSAAAKIVHARPEVKASISAALKITLAQPEVKARRAATVARPEVKVRFSAAIKAALAQPEVKARRLATEAKPKIKARRLAVARNRPPRGKYKGIYPYRSRWRAAIKPLLKEKKKYLGTFNTPEEAAQAYNDAVDLYWGGNGYKNPV